MTVTRRVRIGAALAAALWLSSHLAASPPQQAPQPASPQQSGSPAQPPTPPAPGEQAPIFTASVDVVPVDVSVVDEDGNPVRGLTPDDFTLEIDGKPRSVRTVEFIAQGAASGTPGQPPVARPTHYSANDREAVGRLVMVAVDESSFSIGDGRSALAAATGFVNRLSPNDHLGLVVFPGVGPNIDFTTNHAVVRQAIGRITGKAETFDASINVGTSEAVAIDRGDREALRQVIARECQNEDALCGELVEREARMIANFVVVRARTSLAALRGILAGLRQIEGTKNVILVSGGLISDSLQADIADLGLQAQASQVNIYVLQIDLPRFDASVARLSPTFSQDEQLRVLGLETLAGAGRGALFRIVGSSTYAFDRVARELSGYYLLTFEPEGEDRDRKRHRISVKVKQRGLTVRARREFTALPDRTASTERDQLLGLLRAPLSATKLPLKVTTYTYQENRGSRLRSYIAAEMEATPNEEAPTIVGFTITNDKGNLVANGVERVGSAQFVTSALLEPGPYRLKIAAIDAEGRQGSLEHRFRAEVTSSGPLKLGSLMLAQTPERAGAPPRPAVNQAATDLVTGYVEVYSDQRQTLQNTTVHFEVAEDPTGEALLTAPPDRTQPTGRRRPAQGLLAIRLLPPGDYVLRAVVRNAASETVTTLSRPFTVARMPSAMLASAAGLEHPALRLRPEPRPFVKDQALQESVLDFFLNQLAALPLTASAASFEAVMQEARGRRFDAAAKAAEGAMPGDRVLAAFMRGLARYEKSDWMGASREFRASVNGYSEFFPALFYIGACLAASGRDGDAVAAWQTSLSIDNEAPPTFPLLAEALFRLNDGEQAAAILEEARELWPDDEQFTGRLATAYAMMGRQDDAFAMLEEYLRKQPTDVDALFLALRLLYEARIAGRSYHGEDGDTGLFRQYAASYVDASGPNRPIVNRWVRHMELEGGSRQH